MEIVEYGLDDKQERMLGALITNWTVQDAAKELGLHPSTIYKELKNPTFMHAYRSIRKQIFDQTITTSANLVGVAQQRLGKILKDPNQKTSDHVAAAKVVLEYASKMMEIEEIAKRIEQLEKSIAQSSQGKELLLQHKKSVEIIDGEFTVDKEEA